MSDFHYKNAMLARELINASAKKNLEEAIEEWSFSHFGIFDDKKNCQLCHSSIKLFTAIKNKINGVVLLIGSDCYDKLLRYADTRLIASNIAPRKKIVSEIKKFHAKNINESFLKWFQGQDNLPDEVISTLEVITSLGYSSSIEAAIRLVEYYKHHRIFPIGELLNSGGMASYNTHPHRRLLSENVTLAKLPKFKKVLSGWKKKLVMEESRADVIATLRREFVGKDKTVSIEKPTLIYYSHNDEKEEKGKPKIVLKLKFYYNGSEVSVWLPHRFVKASLKTKRINTDHLGILHLALPERFHLENFVAGYFYFNRQEIEKWMDIARKK